MMTGFRYRTKLVRK